MLNEIILLHKGVRRINSFHITLFENVSNSIFVRDFKIYAVTDYDIHRQIFWECTPHPKYFAYPRKFPHLTWRNIQPPKKLNAHNGINDS